MASEPQPNAPAFLYHGDFTYADVFAANDSTAEVISLWNTLPFHAL